MGLESGDADGWPATDWIENLILAEGGVEAYDAWTTHEMPFDSPIVRRAFQRFGEVAFTAGSVVGGPEGAAEGSFDSAQAPMFSSPPGCWLYLFPSFAAAFMPDGEQPGRTTDTFPFPPAEGQEGGVLGGGEMIGAFSDRPEVREVIRFFLSPDYGVEAAESGLEYISPHHDFDLGHYPPLLRRQAEVLRAALAADTFRFDASDLMPAGFGDGAFWDAMMTYVQEGPDNLDEVLAFLDSQWPDTG
jgi:alpha-glucoside transport system substrate-binding protein